MTAGAPAATLTPDLTVAATFIAALTGSPDAQCSFQSFDDSEERKDKSLARIFHGSLSGVAGLLTSLNNLGAGIFITVNATDLRGRAATNIVDVRALFVDKDDGPLDIRQITMPPSMRVRTPGGEHAYWLVRSGEPRSEFTAAQKILIKHFSSDETIHDLSRVLRLPGFFHQKAAPVMIGGPELGAVWYGDPTRRTIAEIMTAYPKARMLPQPMHVGQIMRPVGGPTTGSGTVQRGGRNNHLTSIAGSMRSRGMSHEAIYAALVEENKALAEPLEANEVETIAQSVARYEPGIDFDVNSAIGRNAAPLPAGLAGPGSQAAVLATGGAWMSELLTEKNGLVKVNVGNVVKVLRNAWPGVLAYNLRTCEIVFTRDPPFTKMDDAKAPRAFTDKYDDVRTAEWFTESWRMPITSGMAVEAIECVAREKSFDPVVDYLNALPEWDGVERIGTWLHDFAEVPDSDYTRAVGFCWLIQAIARAMRPGCQADATLILEGDQGKRKSTFLRALVGDEFFSDQLPDLDSKDAKQQVHGPWVIEIAELAAFSKKRVEQIKHFLVMRFDRFRPPYGRLPQIFPRRVTFAGSVNPNQYLQDATGARRFWPVKCGELDVEGIAAVRDQIWAEALYYFRNQDRPEHWWLTRDEEALARVEQDARYMVDELEGQIIAALENGVRSAGLGFGASVPSGSGGWGIAPKCESVTVGEIITHVCGGGPDLDPRLQERIGKILTRLKWERRHVAEGPRRFWRYFRP